MYDMFFLVCYRGKPIASSSKKSVASSAPLQRDFFCKDKGSCSSVPGTPKSPISYKKASSSTPNEHHVPLSPSEDIFFVNEDY